MTIFGVYNHMQIDNVIVEYRDRPEGSESKLNTYSDGFKVLRTIVRLYRDYKPMGFFTILSFILAALGVGFFVPVFMEYVETGLVEKFPTLIVCGFVLIAALQTFFTGLTLSQVNTQNRRDFEYRFTSVVDKERNADDEK